MIIIRLNIGDKFINNCQNLEYIVEEFIGGKGRDERYVIRFTKSNTIQEASWTSIVNLKCKNIYPLVNNEYISNEGEPYKVLKYEYNIGKHQYYSIEFLNFKNEHPLIRSSENIKKKNIKCPYLTTFKNIGSIGYVEDKRNLPYYKRALSTWDGIIKRCYDKNHIAYKNYGEKGIYICDE